MAVADETLFTAAESTLTNRELDDVAAQLERLMAAEIRNTIRDEFDRLHVAVSEEYAAHNG